jgi:hypothetical protein
MDVGTNLDEATHLQQVHQILIEKFQVFITAYEKQPPPKYILIGFFCFF